MMEPGDVLLAAPEMYLQLMCLVLNCKTMLRKEIKHFCTCKYIFRRCGSSAGYVIQGVNH